jgi:hypothetical protein
MSWIDFAREIVELLLKRIEAADDMRAEKRDGKTVMPPFDELGGSYDERAFAADLLHVACKAYPSAGDAIAMACANAKGIDHDVLRELVALISAKR